MNIAAGIVLFNPNLDLLKKNVNSIYSQVDRIVLVDNCSSNFEKIYEYYFHDSKFYIIRNEENLGVAKALNQMCEWASANKFSWVLTLDQDSISPSNMIKDFCSYCAKQKTAILCPVVWYKGEKYMPSTSGKTQNVKVCITSGSLMNLEAWKTVEGLDEKMFIDMVDTEYCYRVRKAGYNIVRVNNVIMRQQLGTELKACYVGKKRRFFITNHSPKRCFYVGRNCIYVIKKHGINAFLFYSLKALAVKVVGIVFWEHDKWNKLKSLFKGIFAGINMEIL